MELLLPLIVAAAITVVLVPLLQRYAVSLRVLDGPGQRKVHSVPMPRIGGLAMALGGAVPMLIWLPLDRGSIGFIIGASIVFLFGLWDDRSDLRPSTKLLGQAIGVAVVMLVGDVAINSMTFTTRIGLPPWAGVPMTFLFMLGITNAINLSDGLDGLAGGTSLLVLAMIVALGIDHGTPGILTVGMVTIGCLLGFLRYNSFPARIFMGDSGSQLLGFTLGVLSIEITQASGSPYSAALPLLLLGLPIIDMLEVIATRIREGRSPFSADRNHMHHRLLALGFDHFESVAIIYLMQGLLLVTAWLMRFKSDAAILGAFVLFAFTVPACILHAQRTGWRWVGVSGIRLTPTIAKRVHWLKSPSRLPRWGNVIAWCCISMYCLLVATTADTIPPDVAWLALVLAVLLLFAAGYRSPPSVLGRTAHVAAFVAVVVAAYLDHMHEGMGTALRAMKWVLFPTLLFAILVRLRFWPQRRFELTPLDVLVVFMAIVLPNLPGLHRASSSIALTVAVLITLMYGVEMMSGHSDRVRRWLWSSLGLALAVIALRGFL